MKYYTVVIIIFFFSKLIFINAKSTTKAIEHEKIEIVDKLMTLWYHVESMKTCGNNLQKLNIDLEPFWSVKFKNQLDKAIQLANIVNEYLTLSESSSFELTFMSSLSHFMIDQKDPFLVGYGVVSENECIYVRKEGNLSIIDRTCYSLHLKSKYNSKNGYILENANEIDDYLDCRYWYLNLKKLYLQHKFSKNFNSNYLAYLSSFHENTNFSSKLFCGPIFECEDSKSDWVLLYMLPIFDKEKNFKGSILIKLLVSKLDVNQCSDGDPVFKDTHKCKPFSDCVHKSKNEFSSGNYECHCQKGFINNISKMNFFNGSLMEELYWKMKNQQNNSYLTQFNCLPCSDVDCCSHQEKMMDSIGTKSKNLDLDSYLSFYSKQSSLFWHCRKYNMPLRYTILTIQIVFVLITILLAFLVFYSRHNKIIKHSMWVLLVIILFGAFLLYSSLILQHFEPTTNLCLAIPWFREIGFTVIYGILNLRLYKILVEFQSRKAHVVHLKDKDILRILFFIVVCVFGYLTAWTLVDLDYASEGFSLVTNTSLKGFVQYPICKIKWWDYFIEIAEFLFICVGYYLLYCTRTAPSEYNERKFISLVIYCEGIISTLLHIIKHSIFSSIHPDTILILYFIRCQATVTIMILFIFFTKLFLLARPNSDEYCRSSRLSTIDGNEHPDSIRFQIGMFGKSDFDNGNINFGEVEPEEIRSELKRLYTQLHVYKTKSVKKDNPHLHNKRRGGKKNRRFSNQFSKAIIRENDSNQVKTPDESICSNDATILPHSIVCSETGDLHNLHHSKS